MTTDPVPLIDRFAASYFTLNSIGESRRATVLTALRRYEEFLSVPIEQAGPTELRAYVVSLLDGGLKPSTTGLALHAILPFYGWCWQEGVISAEQLMQLRTVRGPRGYRDAAPRPYSRKELAALWRTLEERFPRLPPVPKYGGGRHPLRRYANGTSHFRNIRRHVARVQIEAWIELALVCGLRAGEIYSLSIDDVHWDNKYITVHGKRVDQNEKVRDVPYPESTRTVIREWLRLRNILNAEHDRLWLALISPRPAAPLNQPTFKARMARLGFELHRLRHTCATERLRAGMEIEKVQRLLGHASIQQTLAYAKLVRSDVHRSAEATDEKFQRAIRPAA